MGIPLLTTKFSVPPPRLGQVARPFLLQKLDEVLLPGCRLALLSAPAGFGKTTLLSEWSASLAERGVALAWLTLDAADSDLGRFLHYLLATVQKVYPQVGQSARALHMAAPQDYLRMFLDEGAGARALLAEFRLKITDVGLENSDFRLMLEKFIDRLLAAFDQPSGTPAVQGVIQIPQLANKNQAPSQYGEQPPQYRGHSKIKDLTSTIVEPLSPRELEVLALMAGGLSNAEIASKLCLTVNTLKAHSNSIYGKLDVHSRMQAVIRARELGLLPPEF